VEDVYFYAAYIPIVAYSIILHEIAHAVAALWSGDDTAKLMNRITLNPIPHIDLFGTVIIPGVLIMSTIVFKTPLVVFGWAKPVPVNPYRYRNPVRNDIFVSLAGVTVNLGLAFVFVLLLHLTHFKYVDGQFFVGDMNSRLFLYAAMLNGILAIFNLMPIPPLDGSHVLKYLLPREMRLAYERLAMYGMFLVFIFLMVGRELMYTMFYGLIRIIMFLCGHGW
jgi:Zn-dependent protease